MKPEKRAGIYRDMEIVGGYINRVLTLNKLFSKILENPATGHSVLQIILLIWSI